MYKNSIVHYIAKAMVDVMFYGGIACVAGLPFLLNSFQAYFGYTRTAAVFFLTVLEVSGICAVYLMYQMKRMFQTLLSGNPFVEQNITCFRNMAVACSLISAVYVVKCLVMFTLATAIIVAVFVIGTLFCLTLKDIFKQAAYYKEEHDWTV